MSNALDTIRQRITIVVRPHGYFLKVTGPAEYAISGGVKCVSKVGETVIEGSVVWHDDEAVMVFGRPDVDGYFRGESHELHVGDAYKGIDATKILDSIANYIVGTQELHSAVMEG